MTHDHANMPVTDQLPGRAERLSAGNDPTVTSPLLPAVPGNQLLPPMLPTTATLRRRAVQGIQRTHGNQYVQRLVQRDPAPAADDDTAVQPLDVSGLGVREELPGAGLNIQRSPAHTTIQRQTAATPVANVNMTTNQPSVQIRPSTEIGAAHGQAGAVGWTTPVFNIAVPFGNTMRVDINITLDFTIELPSDYDGPRQTIVSDHEIGHVRIGERKAQEHLVTGLKTAIEANTSGLTPTNVQSAIQAAATAFRTAERTGSQNYDNADYPRMVEAYRGSRASLRQLSAESPAIAAMARSLRFASSRIYSSIRNFDADGVASAASGIGMARSALSNQELWRLQYNADFQNRVGNLRTLVDGYLSGRGLLGMPFDTLPDDMRASLESIIGTLGGFTFSPSGASAGF